MNNPQSVIRAITRNKHAEYLLFAAKTIATHAKKKFINFFHVNTEKNQTF